MTDLRAEATRIGFWNEGLGNWADEREDDPTHECD
jgi:hypothetical protein